MCIYSGCTCCVQRVWVLPEKSADQGVRVACHVIIIILRSGGDGEDGVACGDDSSDSGGDDEHSDSDYVKMRW